MSIILRDKTNSGNGLAIDSNGKAKVTLDGEVISTSGGGSDIAKSGRAFVATSDLITIASQNETPFVLLKNPAGSGRTAFVTSFGAGSTDPSTDPNFLKVYRNPTITNNGTVKDINNLFYGGGNSEMNLYTIPSVSANGDLLFVLGYADSKIKEMGGIWAITEGEEVLFTTDPDASGKKHKISISWVEEDNN